MSERWFEVLRPVCKQACLAAESPPPMEVALFYLARWCQKRAKKAEPGIDVLMEHGGREVANRIVRNLAEDGERVERLVRGDAEELSKLRRLLLASARPRAGEAAPDYADEARQRIAVVLIGGTPPSHAAEKLERGPDGPRNEYVFTAPFEPWARRVVINLVIDERRREARQREGPPVPPRAERPEPLDKRTLKDAHDALPDLVEAIRELPQAQRSAMVLSLSRPDVDEEVRDRLHELDPELFSFPGVGEEGLCSSDEEIAQRLGSTVRSVAANRSLGRRKLAGRDPAWELLLDQLLPHKSTRPVRRSEALAGSPETTTPMPDD
jgi:hypothetical protein